MSRQVGCPKLLRFDVSSMRISGHSDFLYVYFRMTGWKVGKHLCRHGG
jgi:hypothetical protein